MGKDQRSLQETWKYQRNISSKKGTIKDVNGKDLADTEEIKKRWKESMEELYKKIQMNSMSRMVWLATQSQAFWKSVKWALGIAVNRASGCDKIPVK